MRNLLITRRELLVGKIAIIFAFVFCTTHVWSQTPITQKKLIIGIKKAPPFVIKSDKGWDGISIELWEDIADDLEVEYEFKEMTTIKDLLKSIEERSLDIGVAALTVTAKREKGVDFTHPFYASGLSVAVHQQNSKPLSKFLAPFLSMNFIKAVAALSALILVVGLLLWFFEHKANKKDFGGGVIKGIGSGFWLSIVTMTTVGYGDKAPKTVMGRIIATIWMFSVLIFISSFIAAISSSLTVAYLGSPVQSPNDLAKVSIGSVPGSTSEGYLRKHHLSYWNYETPAQGLSALVKDEVEAVVYDAPILKHLANTEFKGKIHVLPFYFDSQLYAFALPSGSTLREDINTSLLELITRPKWKDTLYKYLGE